MADAKEQVVLLRAVPTGRKWGDKVPEKEASVTIGGVKCRVVEKDSWEGGVRDEGIRQQYHRCTWLYYPTVRWDHG